MGEAKQRKAAKASGNPWPRDVPQRHPHDGQYFGDDGEWHDQSDWKPRRGRETNLATVVALAALLTSCASALPVVVASSYVAGQVGAAYAPDSIERSMTP